MNPRKRNFYWSTSLILVLAVHVGVFVWALYWHPHAIALSPPPAAMMVELQPLAPPPPPPPPQPQVEPEPEPEPPKVVEAPKPKLVIEQPKPKPKPKPPKPKPPEPKPQPPQPQTEPQPSNTPPAAPQQAAPRKSTINPEDMARSLWLSKVHAYLSSRMHYPQRERRFNKIGDRKSVMLSFIVDANGSISQAEVKNSNAKPSFDRDVLQQLRRAGSVPRPPAELLSGGQISLNFPLNFELTR
jgi:protein TonB